MSCVSINQFLVLGFAVAVGASTIKDGRIWGSIDAQDGEFPYQVSLRYSGKHICGGSIIDNSTILTAAHCVVGIPTPGLKIVVGTIKMDDDDDKYDVDSIIRHAEYGSFTKINDIALVKLKKELVFNSNIQPIPLESSVVGGDVDCTLTGWGKGDFPTGVPNNLQKIDLKTITVGECQHEHSSPVYETQVCTFTRFWEGACEGDSGGPLVAENKQIGIVSWGIPCAAGYPDVYTRVPSYIDWIEENR